MMPCCWCSRLSMIDRSVLDTCCSATGVRMSSSVPGAHCCIKEGAVCSLIEHLQLHFADVEGDFWESTSSSVHSCTASVFEVQATWPTTQIFLSLCKLHTVTFDSHRLSMLEFVQSRTSSAFPPCDLCSTWVHRWFVVSLKHNILVICSPVQAVVDTVAPTLFGLLLSF